MSEFIGVSSKKTDIGWENHRNWLREQDGLMNLFTKISFTPQLFIPFLVKPKILLMGGRQSFLRIILTKRNYFQGADWAAEVGFADLINDVQIAGKLRVTHVVEEMREQSII